MRSRIHMSLAAALLMLMCGCIKDYQGSGAPGESTITLRLNVPGGGNGGTRSIAAEPDAAGENKIGGVAVLALTKNGSDWVFNYQAEIVGEVQNGAELVITARAREMSTAQQFVILANAAGELSAAAPVRYENIAAIENRLLCTTGGGEWPANNNDDGNFTPFPMYARTGEVTVGASNNSIGTYQLIRMVARIDVTLHGDITPAKFKLTEACLFNYRTAGYVSYANSGFDGSVATTPAVPASGNPTGEPIRTVLYNADASGKILSSIYTFESPAITSDAGRTTGTALVIGGLYNGETDPAKKSYYRIDLKTTDDNVSTNVSSGILRNHRYNVEIQSVTGSGYDDPKEAYLGGSQLSAKVEKWDEAGQSVIGDGQYWLTVDKDELFIPAAGGSGNSVSFTAETNYNITTQGYPAGIRVNAADITYSSGSGWITPSVSGSTVTLTAIANPGSTFRKAKVHVKAGNMTKIINVTQGAKVVPAHFGVLGIDSEGRLSMELTETTGDMIYFKFGSVVGFTTDNANNIAWDDAHLRFNPTADAIPGYENIPCYVSGESSNNDEGFISRSTYHNGTNVKNNGKGDPCKLVGKTAAEIREMSAEEINAYESGWRLPTSFENAIFCGLKDSDQGSFYRNYHATLPHFPYYGSSSGVYTTTMGTPEHPARGYFPIGGGTLASEATGRTFNSSAVWLPTTGHRERDGKSLYIGETGDFWAGTVLNDTGGYGLSFQSTIVSPTSGYYFTYGFAIRCVPAP